jgi:hypothetical protein
MSDVGKGQPAKLVAPSQPDKYSRLTGDVCGNCLIGPIILLEINADEYSELICPLCTLKWTMEQIACLHSSKPQE